MTRVQLTISDVQGSSPREPGTSMVIWPDPNGTKLPGGLRVGMQGTIGGGQFELAAIRFGLDYASDTTRGPANSTIRHFPLGPALGQCCGGVVSVRAEVMTLPAQQSTGAPELPDLPTATQITGAPMPVWIWGAGHVGQALINTMAPYPQFQLSWIDTAPDRFPAMPAEVTQIVAADPHHLIPHAPKQAHHLIVTYSHDIDLALCHGLLAHGFGSVGLIGSRTKWARFQHRLGKLGHPSTQISRINCPIGDPSLGKHPQAIAVGVAAQLLRKPDVYGLEPAV